MKFRRTRFDGVVIGLAAVLLALFVIPLLALTGRGLAAVGRLAVVGLDAVAAALSLSLMTTAVSMATVVLFGTPLAYALSRYQFRGKALLTTVVELPVVMPPVVAGLALLAAFGRRGVVGAVLADLGVTVTFTPLAVVLAQVFVAAPFFVRAVQARFDAIPRELEDAAAIDGADRGGVVWWITLPLSTRALVSGLMLSWARALGEFGATILFAGNLPGRTQTMPLLVYSALERDLNATYITALILLALAAVVVGSTRLLSRQDEAGYDPLGDR